MVFNKKLKGTFQVSQKRQQYGSSPAALPSRILEQGLRIAHSISFQFPKAIFFTRPQHKLPTNQQPHLQSSRPINTSRIITATLKNPTEPQHKHHAATHPSAKLLSWMPEPLKLSRSADKGCQRLRLLWRWFRLLGEKPEKYVLRAAGEEVDSSGGWWYDDEWWCCLKRLFVQRGLGWKWWGHDIYEFSERMNMEIGVLDFWLKKEKTQACCWEYV